MRVETAGEGAYFRLSDRLRPAFGLDVDAVNAEGIQVDDAVYAAVSGASEMVASSIADGLKETEDGLLEALGLEVDKGVEDVGGEASDFSRSESLLALPPLGSGLRRNDGRTCILRSEWRGVFLGGIRSFDRLSSSERAVYRPVGDGPAVCIQLSARTNQ